MTRKINQTQHGVTNAAALRECKLLERERPIRPPTYDGLLDGSALVGPRRESAPRFLNRAQQFVLPPLRVRLRDQSVRRCRVFVRRGGARGVRTVVDEDASGAVAAAAAAATSLWQRRGSRRGRERRREAQGGDGTCGGVVGRRRREEGAASAIAPRCSSVRVD